MPNRLNFEDFLKPEGFAEIRKDPNKMEVIRAVSKRLASDPVFLAHVEKVLNENSESLQPMENALLELSSFGWETELALPSPKQAAAALAAGAAALVPGPAAAVVAA